MDSRVAWLALWMTLYARDVRADGEQVRVTVAVAADSPLRAAMEAHLAQQHEVPVEVRVVTLPEATSVALTLPDPGLAQALSEARTSYVEADFEACLTRLPEDAALTSLFAREERTTLARVLMYRAACQAGRGAQEEAARAALDLARFGLEVPPDVGAVTPDVERMLTDALRSQRAAPRATLRVQSQQPRLSVLVDGRALGCLTPCSVDLTVGDHIVAVSADGITPQAQRVTLSKAGSSVMLVTATATPELALAQWRARYGAGVGLDSAGSLALLAQAVRAPRLVLISTEPAGAALLNLRGAYGQDGAIVARTGSERVALSDAPDESVRLLEDLLVRGKTLEPARPLWKSPWFWASVGVVAAGAVTTTALLLHEPKQRTEVGFQ